MKKLFYKECHPDLLSSPKSLIGDLDSRQKHSGMTVVSYLLAKTVLLLLLCPPLVFAADKIRIVATTSTIASLAREVLGSQAEIHYVAPPGQNIHFIQPTPKDVLKVKKADVFLHGGLDLEVWRDPLLTAAGNHHLMGRGKASVDVSQGISLLEIPNFLSRSEGDLHAFGNPHYATDPENAKIMLKNIVESLSKLYPDQSESFKQKQKDWEKKLEEKISEWKKRLSPYEGAHVVTYHRSWPYFLFRFKLKSIGELEPKPGIPPTPKHISNIKNLIKEKNARVIIKETFNESGTPKKLEKETGAKVVTLAQHVGETQESADYISMTENNVKLIEEALKYK